MKVVPKRQTHIARQLLEFSELLRRRLDELDPPRPINWLSRSKPQEPFPPAVRTHPGFIWLEASTHYAAAKRRYDEHLERVRAHRRDIAVVDFMQLVSLFAGSFLKDPSWQPRTLNAKKKKRVVALAGELLELMAEGASLERYSESSALEDGLRRLQIATRGRARDYRGKDAAQKTILMEFARALLSRGLRRKDVTHIVEDLAPLFGFSPVHGSIQRYVAAAVQKDARLKQVSRT